MILPNGRGNIDHILLGPNGIFTIETKDLEGNIRCDGDNWYQYKPEWKISQEYEIPSVSKQAKKNAVILKEFIESNGLFPKHLRLWVEALVVFTNDNLELTLNNPTVPILKVEKVSEYIQNKKASQVFLQQVLESIGTEILENIEN